MSNSRYTFDRYAVKHDTGYSVTAVAEVSGYATTWYVEPDPTSHTGWRIWKPTPSNHPAYITPSGALGRRILARVAATQARFGDQTADKV